MIPNEPKLGKKATSKMLGRELSACERLKSLEIASGSHVSRRQNAVGYGGVGTGGNPCSPQRAKRCDGFQDQR